MPSTMVIQFGGGGIITDGQPGKQVGFIYLILKSFYSFNS